MSTVLPDPNRFDIPRIAASPLIGSLEYRPSLGSTQDLAGELAAAAELATPALVLAGEQTAGRGRGQNAWWAAAGALTFSLVLDCQGRAQNNRPDPRQSLAAGLAVCEVICQLAPEAECGLKWPNDVYLAARKVCGVLVETVARDSTTGRRTVLGIGINVNNPLCEASPAIAANATSLLEATRRHHDLTDLLLAVLAQLKQELDDLARNDPEQIERWQAKSLLDGRQVLVECGSHEIQGRCLGIDATGALLVETAQGDQHAFAGEIRWVNPPLA